MKSFLIKINGDYYAGMKEFDNSPAMIILTSSRDLAKVCEGYVNLNSHWQRIYNSMKNGVSPVETIEIKVIC
jgi:ABC-type lipoprotein release transport system permease subunit